MGGGFENWIYSRKARSSTSPCPSRSWHKGAAKPEQLLNPRLFLNHGSTDCSFSCWKELGPLSQTSPFLFLGSELGNGPSVREQLRCQALRVPEGSRTGFKREPASAGGWERKGRNYRQNTNGNDFFFKEPLEDRELFFFFSSRERGKAPIVYSSCRAV